MVETVLTTNFLEKSRPEARAFVTFKFDLVLHVFEKNGGYFDYPVANYTVFDVAGR